MRSSYKQMSNHRNKLEFLHLQENSILRTKRLFLCFFDKRKTFAHRWQHCQTPCPWKWQKCCIVHARSVGDVCKDHCCFGGQTLVSIEWTCHTNVCDVIVLKSLDFAVYTGMITVSTTWFLKPVFDCLHLRLPKHRYHVLNS